VSKRNPFEEITLEEVSRATQLIPELSAEDAAEALTLARVPLTVEQLIERRDDLKDRDDVHEAFRHHLQQCFQLYFTDSLWRLFGTQVTPSEHVRKLERLRSPRISKPNSEPIRLVLERARNSNQTVEEAIAYERRKVSPGRGGARHDANDSLIKLYKELTFAYRNFTGRDANAHLTEHGYYDGPYVRFLSCLFKEMAEKSKRAGDSLIEHTGKEFERQTRQHIRDRGLAVKSKYPAS
jgi:hypothetical protein